MVTMATVEAFSVAEAIEKVNEIHGAFGNDVEIDLSLLAGDNADDRAERLGYAFTWLKKNTSGTQEDTNMAEKFGAIEFNIITDMTRLPQKIASAASAIETAELSGLTGASYKPIMYCGKQVATGVNYCFIAEQTLITAKAEKRIVRIKVNEFQGKFEIVKDSIKVIFE